MNFSERLKSLRKEKGMTQEELSKQASITCRQIQKYEGGVSRPRLAQAEKLADVLNVSVDALLGKRDLAIAEFGEENGAKAERDLIAQAEKFSALFAGGDIPMEDKDAAFRIIMHAYSHATEVDKEKYTPKKYKKSAK